MSSSNSGQQIPMLRNGTSGSSQGETKNRTEKVHNNNIVAAPLKSSGDGDHHHYPDEKFEEFINRIRDETRRIGTTTTTITTNTNNPDEKFEEFINRVRDETRRIGTTTTTNTSTSTTKPVVTGLPLSSAWRSVPNNPKNNNNNNNNNARISKPVSGGTAVELLQKEAMNKKKPRVNYNGKEKEKLVSENIIDSREATKRYGKILPQTMDDEEEEYEVYYKGAIITSSEAIKKYNGTSVP